MIVGLLVVEIIDIGKACKPSRGVARRFLGDQGTRREGKGKRSEEQVQDSGSSKYVVNIDSRYKSVSLTTSCT